MFKKKIYAHKVTSLTEARYFAGMGVDWIGFNCNPECPSFVPSETVCSITPWLAGVHVVAECLNMPKEDLLRASDTIRASYALTNFPEFVPNHQTNLKVIYQVEISSELNALPPPQSTVILVTKRESYFENVDTIVSLKKNMNYEIILGSYVLPHFLDDYFSILKADGILLEGTREEAPGVVNFDKVYEIFDKLNEINL